MENGPTPTDGSPELQYRLLIVPQAFYALGMGGIEVQQDMTIQALRKRGIDVVTYDPWSKDLDVDVVHVFGSDYPQSDLIDRLKARGIPIVLTSMFMPLHPLWKYRMLTRLGSVLPANAVSLRWRSLHAADRVIAISEQEGRDLREGFGLDPRQFSVIANGIEERFFSASKGAFVDAYGLDNTVLCVASIEPRKNQLKVARALRTLDHPVVFIGPPAPHGGERTARYVREFKQIVDAHDHLHWIPGIDHDSPLLSSAYAACKVHVLLSTAEAQGLVTMEATAAGAQAVVSDLPQIRELFDSDVVFSSTEDEESIRKSVQEALLLPRHDWSTKARPSWLMSWDQVALRLDAVYRSVLTPDVG